MDKLYEFGEKVNGYSVIKLLGEGRYGIVYLGENENHEKVIVKQLKLDMIKKTKRKLIYEKKTLKMLDDPRFPRFISNFKDEYREGYILEYIEGKVIEDLLLEDNHRFSKEEIYEYCSKITDMIETLHQNHIVHPDIRPPNLILKENNELALIDFGLARIIDKRHYEKELDYWYLGDFLLHLYYSSYEPENEEELPWYKELDLNNEELIFLKRLMGIKKCYSNIREIREQLDKIKSLSM